MLDLAGKRGARWLLSWRDPVRPQRYDREDFKADASKWSEQGKDPTQFWMMHLAQSVEVPSSITGFAALHELRKDLAFKPV